MNTDLQPSLLLIKAVKMSRNSVWCGWSLKHLWFL